MRLKLWWIMAAIAVLAVGLGGERCRRHYQRCKQAAAYHSKEAQLYAKRAAALEKGILEVVKEFEELNSVMGQTTDKSQVPSGIPFLDRAIKRSNDRLVRELQATNVQTSSRVVKLL